MKTIIKMIELNNLKSGIAAVISFISAGFGTLLECIPGNYYFFPLMIEVGTVDVLLQRGAWTIAIIAGVVSVCNVIRNWFKKKKIEAEKTK
jgi:hypothetical protein